MNSTTARSLIVVALTLLSATSASPSAGMSKGDGQSEREVAALAPSMTATKLMVGCGSRLDGVARTPAGYVAVGAIEVVSPTVHRFDAVACTSTDGRTWTRAPASSVLRNAEMFSVAALGSRVVAVGVDYGTRAGAVWTSTNGRSWRRVATGTLFTSTALRTVIADGSRFVAAGTRYRGPADLRDLPSTVVGSRIWASLNGSSWSYVSGTSTILVGSRVHALLSASNGVIAAGDFGRPLGDDYAAVWSSPQNDRWLPGVGFPTVLGSSVLALGVAGDRVIAFGTNGAAYSVLAEPGDPRSANGGRVWHRLEDPFLGASLCASSRWLDKSAAGQGAHGLVVIVHPCDRPASSTSVVWSPDGVTWLNAIVDLGAFGVPTVTGLVRSPEGLILVGLDPEGGAFGAGIVWLIPDPTAA